MTAKPCATNPTLRCATGGQCRGQLYFDGKTGPGVPLGQVRECKWRERVLEAMRRENSSAA